jgi:hypothetical protein
MELWLQEIIIWVAVGGAVAYLLYRRFLRRKKPACANCGLAKAYDRKSKHRERPAT